MDDTQGRMPEDNAFYTMTSTPAIQIFKVMFFEETQLDRTANLVVNIHCLKVELKSSSKKPNVRMLSQCLSI